MLTGGYEVFMMVAVVELEPAGSLPKDRPSSASSVSSLANHMSIVLLKCPLFWRSGASSLPSHQCPSPLALEPGLGVVPHGRRYIVA